MNIEEFLTLAAKEEASDLFIVAGLPLTMKVNGVMRRINEEKMMPQDTEKIIREIYEKALDRDIDQLLKTGDDDFSFAIPGLSRFRVSAYKQRGSLAAVIRVIAFRLPDYKQLRIPEQVMKLSELNKGLVLVTGPAGSGKSTTLACMIEEINETKEDHIITLEDPLEFLETIRKYENVTELKRSMLVELIDSIYVYQAEGTGKERTQKVEINYRFLCESQCGIA